MGKLFGTDGIRGVANIEPMTAERVLEIGRAIAFVCKKQTDRNHQHTILIGKDTRVSGYMLENALTAGICSMGVNVLLVGPMPTPGIAFLTQSMRADAGLVISASHNPYQDNGIKIFSRDGYKLPDSVESEIEELVLSGEIKEHRTTKDGLGRARRIDDAIGRYIVFCKNTFPNHLSLEGTRIVLDCSNGATYKVAPIIFRELGADVTAIHNEPDGLNINEQCGSQHTNDLKEKVLELRADIGLAFDGDGDRMIAIDEKGNELNGDHIIAICSKMYKDMGMLENNLAITTVMANFGLFKAFETLGIEYDVAPVGDRYVLEMMKKKKAVIGGESSGHMIFTNHHTTGDGIVSALQLLAAMLSSGKQMSALAGIVTMSPQVLQNITVSRKPPIAEVQELQEAIKQAEEQLAGEGRVLVRYSGTQPMCRVMAEGPSHEITEKIVKDIAVIVEQLLT